jgi:hypothetical protein
MAKMSFIGYKGDGMTYSGEAMELDLFPTSLGGSIPTSPLQFKVMRIEKPMAASVYRLYHYFGEKDFLNTYSFGALYEGEIWGSISFGIPNARNINGLYKEDEQKGVLEITRLAFKPEAPKNSCSRIISIATKQLIKLYPLRLIITYADTAQNHEGTIYKASNFRAHGLTAKKTDFIWPDGKIKKIKGIKYSEQKGEWVERSRKYLFSRQITRP